MGINTGIEWTDDTLNLWEGCEEVEGNPLCENCYARELAKRFGKDLWGGNVPRRAVKSAWKNVNKMQRLAKEAGEIRLVFVMSIGDIFEKNMPLQIPAKNPEGGADFTTTGEIRDLFFERITEGAYPNLVFQFLTKRPSIVMRLVPESWHTDWPQNVWVGTSAGDQKNVDSYLPHLKKIPAPVRFVSMEPLMGDVDLSQHTDYIDWIITGGESGRKARPMHPSWEKSVRKQAEEAGVPYFFKQWGEWKPICAMEGDECSNLYVDAKKYPEGFPEDLKVKKCTVRELVMHLDGSLHEACSPLAFSGHDPMTMYRVGKKKSGNGVIDNYHEDPKQYMQIPNPKLKVTGDNLL